MAAPAVAGAAALLREALRKTKIYNPSAALIKALIVNGAVDLHKEGGRLWHGNTTSVNGSGDTKAVKIGPAPNDIQGWGRLDIAASVENVVDMERCGVVDKWLEPNVTEGSPHDDRLKPDQTPNDSHPFKAVLVAPSDGNRRQKGNIRATLVWSDQAGFGVTNVLALSLVFKDASRQVKQGKAVDRNSTDLVLRRIANNNVQRLEINDIEFGTDTRVEIDVTVTEVATAVDTDRIPLGINNLKAPQAYAVCYKWWLA